MVVVIDLPRYNPLLTYNPILQPTTYLSTIVGTFWPTINYPQNQLPAPYRILDNSTIDIDIDSIEEILQIASVRFWTISEQHFP